MTSNFPTKKNRGDSKRPTPVFPPSSTGTIAETEGRALRSGPGPRSPAAWIGLGLGPLLAFAVYAAIGADSVLGPPGRATAAVASWMACWWLTEALPLAATALLPIVLFPLLGIASVEAAAAPYAQPLIFMFMGGFVIGLAMQRWGLHRRVALAVVLAVGTRPRRLVAGFMFATALLSMWISNTATVIMMLPIGVSVIELARRRLIEPGEGGDTAIVPETDRELTALGASLMLGIAYAASIGGLGTLIGTPPNLVLASFVHQRYGIEVSMLEWLRVGLPLVAVFLPITWLFLVRVVYPVRLAELPGGRRLVADELARLGPWSRGERIVLAVFALVAGGWILRPWIVEWTGLAGLSDPVIAMLGAIALFAIPVDPATRTFAMDWDTAKRLPWAVLILFGGGLSLAAAIAANGVDAWLAGAFTALAGAPLFVAALAVTALMVFLTEITSNTAVATTILPVLAAVAVALDTPPGMLLTAAALAASCAFMLPVATPPNAIVFASGHVTLGQMVRAGIGLNLIAIGLIPLVVVVLGSRLVLT